MSLQNLYKVNMSHLQQNLYRELKMIVYCRLGIWYILVYVA